MAGKILIVEDDPAIARALARLLARAGYFTHAASSGEAALSHLREDPAYDLALLDVALPGMDGFLCCRRLREEGWRQPILMLTGRSAALDKVEGFAGGADDYVTKPFDPAELLARIAAHLRRSREYDLPGEEDQEIALGPHLRLDLKSRDAVVHGKRARLTEREYEVLLLLARQPETALEKTWLFQQVWGNAPEEGIKALAVYIRRLRRKIEDDEAAPRYIQTVRGFGYKLVPGEDQI